MDHSCFFNTRQSGMEKIEDKSSDWYTEWGGFGAFPNEGCGESCN